MSKSWEILRNKLKDNLSAYGSVSQFCRMTGFSRTAVDNWLNNTSSPNIENLDVIADALGQDPAELLQPPEATSKIRKLTPTEALEVIKEALDELEAKKKILENYNCAKEALKRVYSSADDSALNKIVEIGNDIFLQVADEKAYEIAFQAKLESLVEFLKSNKEVKLLLKEALTVLDKKNMKK